MADDPLFHQVAYPAVGPILRVEVMVLGVAVSVLSGLLGKIARRVKPH